MNSGILDDRRGSLEVGSCNMVGNGSLMARIWCTIAECLGSHAARPMDLPLGRDD